MRLQRTDAICPPAFFSRCGSYMRRLAGLVRQPVFFAVKRVFVPFRACLEIEGMTSFGSEVVRFQEKTASQPVGCRGFLTQKMAAFDARFAKSSKKTVFSIFQTSPKVLQLSARVAGLFARKRRRPV